MDISHDRPTVQGIPRWLPASPAEAKALPRGGTLALVLVAYQQTLFIVWGCPCQHNTCSSDALNQQLTS